jgi:lysyl-tRNA synthetase class 2
MPALASSNLSSYDYNPVSQTLTITFHGNRKYSYASVPQSVADGLGSASSAGKYFNDTIKNVYEVVPTGHVADHAFEEKT